MYQDVLICIRIYTFIFHNLYLPYYLNMCCIHAERKVCRCPGVIRRVVCQRIWMHIMAVPVCVILVASVLICKPMKKGKSTYQALGHQAQVVKRVSSAQKRQSCDIGILHILCFLRYFAYFAFATASELCKQHEISNCIQQPTESTALIYRISKDVESREAKTCTPHSAAPDRHGSCFCAERRLVTGDFKISDWVLRHIPTTTYVCGRFLEQLDINGGWKIRLLSARCLQYSIVSRY